MIIVIATIEVKPGKRDAYLAELKRNVPNVLAEKGCIEYGPAVDFASGIKAQSPMRDNVVTLIEKWESVSALQAHFTTPHMTAYRERAKDLLVGSTLQVLEPK